MTPLMSERDAVVGDAAVDALLSVTAISGAALDVIRHHGAEAYPHECCGALFGKADASTIVTAFPLPNTTEEGPRRRFMIRPDDYRVAERAATAAHLDLVGFYHSHPDHPARPSQHDLDHAWPNMHYLIESVHGGRPDVLRAWFLKDDRSAFFETRLELSAPAVP
jgi:proteasome lid subunit RPN8/RPN11